MSATKARIALVVLSCFISAVTGVVLSRGSGESKAAGKGKVLIGLSMDTLKEERWQNDKDLFVQKIGELGAEVLVQAANSDDTRQIQDIQALISRKVDLLLIVPHNGAAMAKGVALAHEAGIPVIAYDRLITGEPVDLYISFDPVRVGEQQAQFLVDTFKGKGKKKIVRILGAKTDNNAVLMKTGQDRILAPFIKSGEFTIVHEDWAENWKPENAKKITQAAIARVGSFDAVLAANDGTAGGAIQALSEEGLAGKVVVTGQDAELSACQRVAAGTQAMTIYKPLKALASLAAETAVKMARGKPVVARGELDNGAGMVPSILMDVYTVTKANMDATVIKDGFHTREEVYRGLK
jgi:D-xylose transport system substrate-binding protein